MNVRTAVTYHRVSTSDQDPTLAREELRRAAAARNLDLVDEVEETGSGARNDRPGLQRVLDLARQHQVNHVLVWKLDRFGRSSLDLQTNIEALNRQGVTFIATSQGIDIGPTSGAMGKLVLQVLAAIAEFDREVIRERTRLGLQAARARGTPLGRKPVPVSAVMVARALKLRRDPTLYQPRPWPAVARLLKREGWPAVHPKTLARAVAGTKKVPGYVPGKPARQQHPTGSPGAGQ
jgi:putative DNA-invertase from lambdoid prophage Rac